MELNKPKELIAHKPNIVMSFLRRLGSKIVALFKPEEVEVTFKVEGKKISYTYTKVEHKQVA